MHLLTKSKYIRGLQCEKAMFLDVHAPQLAYFPREVLERFRHGREFEHSFKDTFPLGIDVSARLKNRMSDYPSFTAKQLQKPGEVTLFEAGFEHNEVLVLADVVHKEADGSLEIYEVKNGRGVTETFRNDVAIQYYVISHAIRHVAMNDIFCSGLSLVHFYVLFNNGSGGFDKEDQMERAMADMALTGERVERFKEVVKGSEEPNIAMSPHCDMPYECPYKRYCRRRMPSRQED